MQLAAALLLSARWLPLFPWLQNGGSSVDVKLCSSLPHGTAVTNQCFDTVQDAPLV